MNLSTPLQVAMEIDAVYPNTENEHQLGIYLCLPRQKGCMMHPEIAIKEWEHYFLISLNHGILKCTIFGQPHR